jgi:hypothetical protein
MTGDDSIWGSKTDEQLSEAGAHLANYTVEAEQIIRAELKRRGLSEPPPAVRPIDSRSDSPVVGRYRDAYRVASATVGLGTAIKVVGVVIAGIIVLGSISSGSRGPFGGGGVVLGGIFLAAVVGILFWVCGVMVAAQGQILRATLDNAVANSPFLNDPERAEAMGLPKDVAARSLGV